MLYECLMGDFQTESLIKNYRRKSHLKVAREESLQKHHQSLSEGFRHINGVLGTNSTGAMTVAQSHQQRSSLYEKEKSVKVKESVKLNESEANAKPRPICGQLIL